MQSIITFPARRSSLLTIAAAVIVSSELRLTGKVMIDCMMHSGSSEPPR